MPFERKLNGRLALSFIVAISVTAIALWLLVDTIKDHNYEMGVKAFCLDQGYPDYRRANGYDSRRYWCVNRNTSIRVQDLGWKE
jgi:hypothetical protein